MMGKVVYFPAANLLHHLLQLPSKDRNRVPASFLAQCCRTVVEGASQERECRSGGHRSCNIGTRTKPTIHHNGHVVLVFWGQLLQYINRRRARIMLAPAVVGNNNT